MTHRHIAAPALFLTAALVPILAVLLVTVPPLGIGLIIWLIVWAVRGRQQTENNVAALHEQHRQTWGW